METARHRLSLTQLTRAVPMGAFSMPLAGTRFFGVDHVPFVSFDQKKRSCLVFGSE